MRRRSSAQIPVAAAVLGDQALRRPVAPGPLDQLPHALLGDGGQVDAKADKDPAVPPYLLIDGRLIGGRGPGSHIDELIDTDNVIAASVVCIEFINMMAAIDRIVEAAHLLRYLRSANDFGALAARTLVTEATRKIAAAVRPGSEPAPAPASVPSIDDRAALGYMRDVLVELAESGARPKA